MDDSFKPTKKSKINFKIPFITKYYVVVNTVYPVAKYETHKFYFIFNVLEWLKLRGVRNLFIFL